MNKNINSFFAVSGIISLSGTILFAQELPTSGSYDIDRIRIEIQKTTTNENNIE